MGWESCPVRRTARCATVWAAWARPEGLLYGLELFLVQDEGLNPILGTSGGPTEYPWQAHARGLVGHLVLGAVTHATLNVLDQVA